MAAGVSFADLLYTQGRYQVRPTLPFAPGMDAAGVVRSAPPGSGFEAGQRVAVLAAYGWLLAGRDHRGPQLDPAAAG